MCHMCQSSVTLINLVGQKLYKKKKNKNHGSCLSVKSHTQSSVLSSRNEPTLKYDLNHLFLARDQNMFSLGLSFNWSICFRFFPIIQYNLMRHMLVFFLFFYTLERIFKFKLKSIKFQYHFLSS